MLSEIAVISITLVAAVLAAVAQYFYKKGVKNFEFNIRGIIGVFSNASTLLGLFVYLASFVFYLYALHATPVISFVYPVFASTFVFVLLISTYTFKEKASTYRIAGMALIILGIIIVSLTFSA